MKSVYFTTEQGNYTFLTANWNKSRSNLIWSNYFKTIKLKLIQSQFQIKICGIQFKTNQMI